MKALLLISIGFFIYGNFCQAQLVKLADLPPSINESSGIVPGKGHTIWTFNDSGGRQELYQCDTTGKLLRVLKIKKAPNDDWEDITKDDGGNFFIGNFGNNSNKRTELSLFKIPNPDDVKGESVVAEKISFRFEDQSEFPPPKNEMNFDCEAVLWLDGYLYLFTKHRTLPMATNLYRIPDRPGVYVAEKLGSFATGVPSEEEHPLHDYWVTAADISPDKSKVALISGSKLWLFYDFESHHFFDGKLLTVDIGPNSQKEAICFVDDHKVYITDELIKIFGYGVGGNIYKVDLREFLN